MDIPATLIDAIRARRAILFVGAGLSSSIGLPLFDVLTQHLGQELGINANETGFAALAEYYLLTKGEEHRLFRWMLETWHPAHIDIVQSRPHTDIVNLGFPVIYTTNYDSWIERAFAACGKPFRKIVRVEHLAQTRPGETEIIKFHGDLEDPQSIILSEANFLRRMALAEPLDIRLHSDSLARPILFVGYSLSDPNIRYLLFRLRQLWSEHGEGSQKPTSYILMVERDPIRERLLSERGVQPIFTDESDPTAALCTFFDALLEKVREH